MSVNPSIPEREPRLSIVRDQDPHGSFFVQGAEFGPQQIYRSMAGDTELSHGSTEAQTLGEALSRIMHSQEKSQTKILQSADLVFNAYGKAFRVANHCIDYSALPNMEELDALLQVSRAKLPDALEQEDLLKTSVYLSSNASITSVDVINDVIHEKIDRIKEFPDVDKEVLKEIQAAARREFEAIEALTPIGIARMFAKTFAIHEEPARVLHMTKLWVAEHMDIFPSYYDGEIKPAALKTSPHTKKPTFIPRSPISR